MSNGKEGNEKIRGPASITKILTYRHCYIDDQFGTFFHLTDYLRKDLKLDNNTEFSLTITLKE